MGRLGFEPRTIRLKAEVRDKLRKAFNFGQAIWTIFGQDRFFVLPLLS
jgi:hypothetical protein